MTFRPDTATAQPPPEDIRKAGAKESPGEEKPPESGLIGWLKRPAVIDGAISGALSGILSGLIIGGLTGGMHATPRKMEFDQATGEVLRHGSSGVLAGVMGGGLSGLTIGFLCGVFLGGLLGLLAEYFQGALLTAARRRALFVGVATGAAVAAIVATYPWIALGVGLGAIAGGIWALLQRWEQASDTTFTSGFQVEEEPPPQATT
jgi:hypothetical protein